MSATRPSSSHAAWWVLAAVTLVRLGAAAAVPLFEDEAYYWEWSRRLAAGYFDHPPLVAWLIGAGTALFGSTPLGVRLGSVACGALAGAAMLLAARRLDGDDAGVRAAWLAALLPVFTGTFVAATPDAPLLAAAAWVCYAAGRAVDDDRTDWWLAAGAALGLGLLAKYTAVLLPLGVLAACLWHPPLRRQLRRPGPWLAVAVALLVASPMIGWNAAHDWVSFRFQLGHGFGRPNDSILAREASYLGGQLLLASPVVLVLMLRAGVRTWAYGARPWRVLLAAVSLVVLVFFALSALRRRPEANWPALAYPAAAVLLATSALVRERARSWRTALAVAGGMSGVLLLASFVAIPGVPPRRDPLRKAHGWPVLADSVAAFAARVPATGGHRLHVAANRYQDAALLGWYLPGRPEVVSVNRGGRPNQYDLWPRLPDRATVGDDLLLVLAERDAEPVAIRDLRGHFGAVERGPLVEQPWRGAVIRRHRLWLLRGWRGTWPPPASRVPPAAAAK